MNFSTIFETERLVIRCFNVLDVDPFFDMMSNYKVMNPIPQKVFTKQESDAKLAELIRLYTQKIEKKIWAVALKNNPELIGLCGLLVNDEQNPELAYRLREKFWQKGYGTEIYEGLILYGFENLKFKLITADVWVENLKSVKILEKRMQQEKEFFNKKDNCVDRRYQLTKKAWLQQNAS